MKTLGIIGCKLPLLTNAQTKEIKFLIRDKVLRMLGSKDYSIIYLTMDEQTGPWIASTLGGYFPYVSVVSPFQMELRFSNAARYWHKKAIKRLRLSGLGSQDFKTPRSTSWMFLVRNLYTAGVCTDLLVINPVDSNDKPLSPIINLTINNIETLKKENCLHTELTVLNVQAKSLLSKRYFKERSRRYELKQLQDHMPFTPLGYEKVKRKGVWVPITNTSFVHLPEEIKETYKDKIKDKIIDVIHDDDPIPF